MCHRGANLMELQDEKVLTDKIEGLTNAIHIVSCCRAITDTRLETGEELAVRRKETLYVRRKYSLSQLIMVKHIIHQTIMIISMIAYYRVIFIHSNPLGPNLTVVVLPTVESCFKVALASRC